jgi:hypothetical protein
MVFLVVKARPAEPVPAGRGYDHDETNVALFPEISRNS